jgi:hypothetical protein
MGYDMDAMVADVKRAREGLQNLDGKRLSEVVRLGIGFFDVIHALGLGPLSVTAALQKGS